MNTSRDDSVRGLPELKYLFPPHPSAISLTLMLQLQPERLILAMTDTDLEKFVREWAEQKKSEYVEVERFTGPGDMGRDVVGYLSAERHEGEWHNYQCKQYGKAVPLGVGLRELGKVLYYAHRGEFTAPTAFFFVAPRSVARPLRALISKPTAFKAALIEKWPEYCENGISESTCIALDAGLKAFIEQWDFSRVKAISVDGILADAAAKLVMVKWFGADPGPAPEGTAPSDIEERELPYVRQLLGAYGTRSGQSYGDHKEVQGHDEFGPHLSRQRERFFDADAFSRFYRDNTLSEEIERLNKDVFHGVADVHGATHADALARVEAVMAQAATVHPSGVLARHARVSVKQGICHHFANEGRLEWQKK